mmetsp:Transcript_89684/g.159328  ORF Transcript_89684/g.159328 Transcript_89684/m.159328 type:complete len:574 (+) Transcript_89684:89-1810(+)
MADAELRADLVTLQSSLLHDLQAMIAEHDSRTKAFLSKYNKSAGNEDEDLIPNKVASASQSETPLPVTSAAKKPKQPDEATPKQPVVEAKVKGSFFGKARPSAEFNSLAAVIPTAPVGSNQELDSKKRRSHQICAEDLAEFAETDIKISKKAMFSNGEKAKERLDEEYYDVVNFYHTEGVAQAIAKSALFQKITLGIISINAIYIGVDADRNKAETLLEADPGFVVTENFFCTFFTFELLVRFMAFAKKKSALRDAWFVFDSCLVALMVAETWVLSLLILAAGGGSENGPALPTGPLRLLRLLRLSRLVRLLRSLPDLLTLVNGMFAAAQAVLSSLFLIVMLNYVFAIIMHMFLKDIPELSESFGTLGLTMWTLILDGTFMDGTKSILDAVRMLDMVEAAGAFLAWSMVLTFTLYILLTNITVMNMLIGVLCEVVSQIKKRDEEKVAINFMKQHLRGMLEALDTDQNGQIAKEELQDLVKVPVAMKVLQELEVNPQYLMDLTESLFEQDADAGRAQEVTREELMEVILKVRGNRDVTMEDIVETRCDLRKVMYRMQEDIRLRFDMIMDTVSRH